jgi:hypothetical protein
MRKGGISPFLSVFTAEKTGADKPAEGAEKTRRRSEDRRRGSSYRFL